MEEKAIRRGKVPHKMERGGKEDMICFTRELPL